MLYHFTDVSSTRFEEDSSLDPTLIQRKIDIPATVNRIRSGTSFYSNCYPAGSAAIADLWTDDGVISFINCAPLLKSAGWELLLLGNTGTQVQGQPRGCRSNTDSANSYRDKHARWLNQEAPEVKAGKGSQHIGGTPRQPLCIHATDNNGIEGYALACNPVRSLWLAGDCQGFLRAFTCGQMAL